MMGQPHHHVYMALEKAIIKDVQIEPLIPHLISRKVLQESDIQHCQSRPKNGMKILIGYMRNQSFEAFLSFVECIFEAQRDAPSKVQAVPVVESMIRAVRDFDAKSHTTHAERLITIQGRYVKQSTVDNEAEQIQERLEGGTGTSLTTSLEHLTLQTALRMPDLDYVEDPIQASFYSSGGELLDFDKAYGFSMSVPPMAVPKGQRVNLKVGLCCYGPFSIPERYSLVSDFAVVVADNTFSKPVSVKMEHCLVLPEYKKCSDVIILKANHETTTKDGLYSFDELTNPSLSSIDPKLSFETDEFCILCAVHVSPAVSSSSLQAHPVLPIFEKQPAIHDGMQSHLQAPSSDEGYHSQPPRKGAYNFGKKKARSLETPSPSQRQLRSSTKRRASDSQAQQGDACARKKRCGVEYAAVLAQRQNKMVDYHQLSYQFIIFITTNCSIANNICLKHAKERLNSTEVDISMIPIMLNEKVLKFETAVKDSEWTVEEEKSPSVSLAEIQFHQMDNSDLMERVKQRTCPPGLLFTAECSERARKRLSCKVTIKGATTVETDDEVFFNISVTPFPPSLPYQHTSLQQAPVDLHALDALASQLSTEEKSKNVEDSHFLKIKEYIRDWRNLARCGFGFVEPMVVQIEDDHRRSQECAHQSYLKWKMRKSVTPSVQMLLDSLYNAKEFLAMEALIEVLLKQAA